MALVDFFSGRHVDISPSTQGESRVEVITVVTVLLAPIVYLSVRHGIQACGVILVLLSAFHFVKNPSVYRQALTAPGIKPLVFAFAALFLATAITQAVRLKVHWSSFDGPSKILLGAAVFLFFRTRNISVARVLEVGLPLGLLAVSIAVRFNSNAPIAWLDRFATSFVDPNSLGSQTLILTMLCLFSIRLFGKEPPWLLLLKVVAAAAGVYITIHAQSRGSWLAILPLLVLWLILQYSRLKDRPAAYLLPLGLVSAAVAAMISGYEYSSIISDRGNDAYKDISDWLNEINLDSPSGIRLSLWKISLSLAWNSPFFGYGETGYQALLSHHPLNTPAYRSAFEYLTFAGPHSDMLAKLLSMGLIGLFAYVATMVIPWTYFWAHRRDENPATLAASHLGMYFITGVFICGLTNEMLSLKYLCSFFGLMIAGLASDVSKRVK